MLAVCRPMSRFMLVFALLATTGCDAKKSTSEPTKSDPVVAKAAVADARRGNAVAPDAVADVTPPPMSLGFGLLSHLGAHIHACATPPTRSRSVTSPRSAKPAGRAERRQAQDADRDGVVRPDRCVRHVPAADSEERALQRRASDPSVARSVRASTASHVPMVFDVAMDVAGIPARKASATGVVCPACSSRSQSIAFAKAHRTMIDLMGLTGSPERAATTASSSSCRSSRRADGRRRHLRSHWGCRAARRLVLVLLMVVLESRGPARSSGGCRTPCSCRARGAEISTFVSEENYLSEDHNHRNTTWWLAPSIGINDQLELTLPVEFDWDRSDDTTPRSTLQNYGAELKYRLVTSDLVDAPDFRAGGLGCDRQYRHRSAP